MFAENRKDEPLHVREPLHATWMPSVLAEGAFLMFPDQEHALRTKEFQHLYALGVVLLWVGFSYHRFRHLIVDDEKKL